MPPFNYKSEANRYRYYYQRLHVFYQKPIIQVSTAVLFTLITISFFAAFAVRPTMQTIAELLKKINDQKQVLASAEKKAASLATAQQQYALVERNIPILDAAIPPEYAIQTLLREIESTASQLGISMSGLRINELRYPSEKSNTTTIKEIAFTINLSASYPLAKQFLVALKRLPRLVIVDTISMSTSQKKSQVTVDNAIELTINCKTFFQSELGENQ